MKHLLAVLLIAVSACSAVGRNVIQEWGAHDLSEFLIEPDLQGNDRGVLIFANSHPADPWLFVAYDDVTQEPGDIDFIRIDPGVTVGDIALSIVGDAPAHLHGAHKLAALDIVTHGTETNRIDQIDLTGDYGDPLIGGPLLAHGAANVDIAGNVVSDINLGTDGVANVNIGAGLFSTLSVAGPLTGLFQCAWSDGDVHFGAGAPRPRPSRSGRPARPVRSTSVAPSMEPSIACRRSAERSVAGHLWASLGCAEPSCRARPSALRRVPA